MAVKSFKTWREMPSKPALEPFVQKTIDICGVRNRASFPLRMFQLEGRVVVDREIGNLVVAYCQSDSDNLEEQLIGYCENWV